MKKLIPPLIISALFLFVNSKTYAQSNPVISTVTGTLVRVTPKLADLDKYPTGLVLKPQRDEDGLIGMDDDNILIRSINYGSKDSGADKALQPASANIITTASATIGTNIVGLPYTFVNPSDPNCAVGPNHVIQTINNSSSSYFEIWNKAGTVAQAQLLISSLTGVQGSGDPVVLYDQLANRWVLTEFGKTGAVSFINTLIVAVSVSDDPTGSWYIYSFVDNTFFVDYPKFSVWHNAYYATSNDFNTAGTAYLGSSIYAFDRTKMLAGNATATAIRSRLVDAGGRYFSMGPVCLEGTTPSTQSGLFAFFQDNQFTSDPLDVDSIFMFEFTPDFVTPGSSVISAFTKLVPTNFDSEVCTATRGQCVSQQGSAVAVEDLAGRIMHKLIYRNFGTYEAIVCNTTVDASGAGRAGIRWWELRRPGGNWGIYQEGTWSPDANHRWLGAICIDAIGNIGLMYNVSGATAFPSIRFTGRNPGDALGTMSLPEQTIIAGTVANSSTRYGDYGTLCLDPSTGRDFWLTAQYNTATTWSTRVATFKINNSTATPKIRFENASLALREVDANIVSGCVKYKDYTVNVVIESAPSANATVTFSTSGAANNGLDYTISPASVVLSSGTLIQPVTIRVFDDAAVEGNESFTISYTINNGGGDAAADVYNQSCLVNIVDNDAAAVDSRIVNQTWGSANVNSITSGPFNGSAITDKRIQNLYLASDLLAAGFSAGNITDFAWFINLATVATFNNLSIKIGFTGATTLTAFDPATLSSIFSGNFTTPGTTGWYNFTLPTPVNWLGTNNIIIETCFDNSVATSDVQVIGTTVAGYTPTQLFRQNAAGNVCATAANASNTARPDIRLKMTIPVNGIATALNTSKTAYLGPNDDVYFYDGTGNIIARVKNLTAFDYGCTQIIIDRAGSSSVQFWNNTTTNYLLSKTCKVIPTNNTASGSYQITLYYTAAEVAGWEAATGRTWAGSAMQVAKVSNGSFIPDITPAAPHTADVSLVTGTKGTFGSNFTILGDFSSTGFSGFGVGVPGNALLASDFRTKATGDFTDGLIWQYNNEGAGYVDALQAPAADNNVNIQAAHTVLLNAAYTINTGKTLTVNGTLNCGTNTISGAGSFVTAAASTLGIGSTAGITASGSTGNIQTTTRTFSTTGNYSYNGAANQAAGNGLPASINNLVIANTGAALNNIVSMGASLSVNGSSTFTSGILSIGSNTLTLNGTASGTGTLTGTASGGLSTSNLVIGGTALNQTLNFTQTTAATRSLNNLTLNSGSSATLGNALDVYGTIALTTATLNLNAQNLTLKSNTNNTARIADLTGCTLSGATNVTMERWIKLRLGGTGRAYRLLAPTVNTTGHPTKPTIRDNWMEGGLNTAIGTNVNPVPLFGTQITGAGGNANGFDKTQSNQSSLYNATNAVTPPYTAIGNTSGTLNALTGYFLYVRGDRSMDMTIPLAVGMPTSSTTLRTTGTLLTGTKTSFTNPFTGGAGVLNLVTNPYPSPIDWALVQPACTNVATSYTFWDPNFGTRGGFVTVNTAGIPSSGLGNRFIQPGQAFFVQSTGGVPTVSIQETHKSAGNNNEVFLVPPPPPESFRTELYFTQPDGYRRVADGVIALFDDRYSAGIDGDDASEINNWDENIAIEKNGKHLAIESRPVIFKTDSLLLFMNNMKKQDYEFEFTPSVFTHPGLKAELVDNFTGKHTILSLTAPTVVAFTVTANPASSASNRFKVMFNAVEAPANTDKGITIFPNPVNGNTISLQFTEMDKGTYTVAITNKLGQRVYQTQVQHGGGSAIVAVTPVATLAKGVYEIVFSGKNYRITKTFIRN